MGFGTSATQSIFFIAAVVVSVGVVGAFETNVSRFAGDIDERSDAVSAELSTDVRIINDPGDMPNNPVVLYVMNIGTKSLAPNSTVVLIDGAAKTTLAFDVLETAEDIWRTGDVLKITVTGENLASGDHRIKVIVGHGVADSIRFNIP